MKIGTKYASSHVSFTLPVHAVKFSGKPIISSDQVLPLMVLDHTRNFIHGVSFAVFGSAPVPAVVGIIIREFFIG